MLTVEAETGGAATLSPAQLRASLFDNVALGATPSLADQAREDAAIWSRRWICIGFSADIPDPGDILPFTVGHHGIHVERSVDGSLVGRFNKAQHGGCRVVPLQCQTGSKTRCSFTACGYSRDRRPIRISDPDRDSHLDQYIGLRPERLLPIDVMCWGPVLLVRLSPEAGVCFDWPNPTSLFGTDFDVLLDQTVWREVEGDWKQVTVALAREGKSDDDKGTLLFPNLVVRRFAEFAVVAVIQPTALDRTLCRFQFVGRRTFQTEAASILLDATLRIAGLDQQNSPPGPIRHAEFEREMLLALTQVQRDEAGTFFRTNGKERW